MKRKLVKILSFISIISILLLQTKVEAAGLGVSANKKEVTVGESFTVTISGVYGKVTISGSNVQLSPSGTQFVDGSLSITATTKSEGTASVSVTAVDTVTTGANPQEVTGSKSVSVTVKAKEVPKPVETPQTTTTPKTTETKKTTTNNKKETKKTETKKTEVVETYEEEEATPQLGIASLKVIGVKENGEEVEIPLDKVFDINIFEYACKVEGDINTVKIQKEAYEYNDLVQIIGLEEPLKVGENIITLKLAKDDKEVSYVINLTKEQPQEEVKEVTAEPEEELKKEQAMVSMPVVWFVLLELAIIGVSVGSTLLIMRYVKKDQSKQEEAIAKPRRKRRNEM